LADCPTCIPLNVERAVFRTPKRHDDDYDNAGRDRDHGKGMAGGTDDR